VKEVIAEVRTNSGRDQLTILPECCPAARLVPASLQTGARTRISLHTNCLSHVTHTFLILFDTQIQATAGSQAAKRPLL